MKIKTDTILVGLDGKYIPISIDSPLPFSIGKAIANLLTIPKKGGKKFEPFKSYELAKKFYNNPEVEVDKADFAVLKEIVEKDENYSALIIGQILEQFENIKEK